MSCLGINAYRGHPTWKPIKSTPCLISFVFSIIIAITLYAFFATGPVAMAKDPLAEAGFYFDELNKLRVLEPDVSQRTSELKEECKEFVDSKHWTVLSAPKSLPNHTHTQTQQLMQGA